MTLSDPVQLALVAACTTLGTALVTAGQTLLQEYIRSRKAPAAHEDIATRVADRIGASPQSAPLAPNAAKSAGATEPVAIPSKS